VFGALVEELSARGGELGESLGGAGRLRTGTPSLGSNVLREILGIIIILSETNGFPYI
jgi:hypothetical protein